MSTMMETIKEKIRRAGSPNGPTEASRKLEQHTRTQGLIKRVREFITETVGNTKSVSTLVETDGTSTVVVITAPSRRVHPGRQKPTLDDLTRMWGHAVAAMAEARRKAEAAQVTETETETETEEYVPEEHGPVEPEISGDPQPDEDVDLQASSSLAAATAAVNARAEARSAPSEPEDSAPEDSEEFAPDESEDVEETDGDEGSGTDDTETTADHPDDGE